MKAFSAACKVKQPDGAVVSAVPLSTRGGGDLGLGVTCSIHLGVRQRGRRSRSLDGLQRSHHYVVLLGRHLSVVAQFCARRWSLLLPASEEERQLLRLPARQTGTEHARITGKPTGPELKFGISLPPFLSRFAASLCRLLASRRIWRFFSCMYSSPNHGSRTIVLIFGSGSHRDLGM